MPKGQSYDPGHGVQAKGELPADCSCMSWFYGFMAFQDTVRQYAVALAEMGYVSYCFDFCGGCVIKGKSDGRTTEMSVLTEVKDLEAVIQYARGRAGRR